MMLSIEYIKKQRPAIIPRDRGRREGFGAMPIRGGAKDISVAIDINVIRHGQSLFIAF
jgi:hypothetical protein